MIDEPYALRQGKTPGSLTLMLITSYCANHYCAICSSLAAVVLFCAAFCLHRALWRSRAMFKIMISSDKLNSSLNIYPITVDNGTHCCF